MDIGVRQETLITMPGQPVLVQLPLIPAYALTVHKTQALSIKHIVRGCIEGVFAQAMCRLSHAGCVEKGLGD